MKGRFFAPLVWLGLLGLWGLPDLAGQRLNEGMFTGAEPAARPSLWSQYEALQDSIFVSKATQKGFTVTFHFSWSLLESFDTRSNFQSIRDVVEKTHPEWGPTQVENHLYPMQYGPLQGSLPSLGAAGRPRGVRLSWVAEELIPVTLTLGTGMTPVFGYVEGTLSDGTTTAGFQSDELRWVSYLDDFARLRNIYNSWYWPDNDRPVMPQRIEMPYLEWGVGKQLNPVWGVQALHRIPLGMGKRIFDAHNQRNVRFENPTVSITEGARFHGGQHFSGLLTCRGRHLVWSLEGAWITAPSGTWVDYLLEKGANPISGRSYLVSGVGFVF
jgi:hypothetical protein